MQITGVYSAKQIKEALKQGNIVCSPLNDKNINGSSIDVTLGSWYYQTENDGFNSFYNPFSEADVKRYFKEPLKAKPVKDYDLGNSSPCTVNIPAEHPVIILKPLQRILAHTCEFIGIKNGTSSMQARSTWGRNGIAVCLDAGWGDPGYINRWTMEIYNFNQSHNVILPVGERIAQIVFYHTGEIDGDYLKLSGKYQEQGGLKQLMNDWCPQMMLPRAYKDKREMPKLF